MSTQVERENFTPRVDGNPFRCECGCNVFHKPTRRGNIYECNACGAWYAGEPAAPEEVVRCAHGIRMGRGCDICEHEGFRPRSGWTNPTENA